MSNASGVSMDQGSIRLGLLMETAQSHQKLAEKAIESLNEHTEALQTVVRDQVRLACREEFKTVDAEIDGAVQALRALKRAANARTTFWTLGVIAIAAANTILIARLVLPKPAEISALRAERDELVSNIGVLDQRGARADLRRCGTGRLCVRVDLKAPRYGEDSDYMVIRGY
jgi:hypothetical protein